MSSQPPRPVESGRSVKRVILDLFLLVAIPTVVIFIISKVWK